MKKINSEKLKKGDIILSTSTAWESLLIQRVTGSDISHAMICVAGSSVMDSTGEGVHARNIAKMHYEDQCGLYVYRLAVEPPAYKLEDLVNYVRLQTGSPYATREAMLSPIAPKIKGSKDQFCSRLVAQAFAMVGLPLVENSDFATPAEIQRSQALVCIDDITVQVSKEEEDWLTERGDTTIGMRYVTNVLLKALRALAPNVRSMSDVVPHLLRNRYLDEGFYNAFKASGYLSYYEHELLRFPWRYDIAEMVKLFHSRDAKDAVLEYCQMTLDSDASGDFSHWEKSAIAINDMAIKYRLESLNLQRDLYQALVTNHHRRVQVARIMLKTYGPQSNLST